MNYWFRTLIFSITMVMAPWQTGLAEEIRGLVLVTDVKNDMRHLSLQEIRRAYLGEKVIVNGYILKPLINMADDSMYEIFLQKVMFMSAQAYQRQLLRRFLHAQGKRPAVFRDHRKLMAAIAEDPHAVTYMIWMDEATKHTNLKVVAILWNGNS